jgi:hypothetical protein
MKTIRAAGSSPYAMPSVTVDKNGGCEARHRKISLNLFYDCLLIEYDSIHSTRLPCMTLYPFSSIPAAMAPSPGSHAEAALLDNAIITLNAKPHKEDP